jgi:hypothetical protein
MSCATLDSPRKRPSATAPTAQITSRPYAVAMHRPSAPWRETAVNRGRNPMDETSFTREERLFVRIVAQDPYTSLRRRRTNWPAVIVIAGAVILAAAIIAGALARL